MTTEMNLAEAENLVAKLLPEWMDTASSNFAGFAEMLLNDYEDWARDTMECVLMPSEDEFVRTFEAWKLVAARYFNAMCRPVPSFKTADGVTCYVGDLVYTTSSDGVRYEVDNIYSDSVGVRIHRQGKTVTTWYEFDDLYYYEPEAPKSLKTLRDEKQAERKQAERKAATEFEKKVRRDMLAALNDRGSFHERLLWELTEANGYIGIKTSMDESDWETFLDTDAGAEAVAWWESRDVRFKISEWEKGVILYVDGVNPNTFHCTCFDFKTWGEYQHLAR